MITGILDAIPGGPFFENVVLDLQAIADAPIEVKFDTQEARLPQVHAMNCLKDVFSNTRLGSRTEPYLADTLDIACCSLESDL